ncbi:MAG: 50S ribosomal protein L6 [Bacteroides sp.]
MSRIGKLPISIPAGVTVTTENSHVTVKGPKGEMSQKIAPSIEVKVEGNEVVLSRTSDAKQDRAYHGLYRALINNMVVGVSEGFKKELELVGVGFRAGTQPGNILELNLGFTHSILMQLPSLIKFETKSERNKNPLIMLESCDKHLLGQVCAKIRSFRKPEPYKGKGVKFVGEEIRRKSGKAAAAAAK